MEMTKNEAVIGAKGTKATTASAAAGAAIDGEASLRLREACQQVLTFPGKALSGLAVILLRDGRIVWEDYFGMRRFAGTAANATGASGTLGDGVDLPVDAETRWRVASISKPTATLGAMRLVEKGLLDLDRDISAYMGYPLNNPWFPAKAITTRMLLGHSFESPRRGLLLSAARSLLTGPLCPTGPLLRCWQPFCPAGSGNEQVSRILLFILQPRLRHPGKYH